MLTDAAIIAICTATPLLTAQIVNVIISFHNKQKLSEVALKVDGTATAAQAREDSLQKELKLMREAMAERKETAALLAQSAAQVLTGAFIPVAPVVNGGTSNPPPVQG